MRTTYLHGLLVATVAGVVLLTNLGGPALWDEDEPKNAACSLAMLERGDWVVPTLNGALRIEKPVLTNWLQIAGFWLAGPNETGARLASALLSIGTCLLTWRIGCELFRPAVFAPTVGLLGGLAMATSLWMAVGGRAATPDAPLLFCTTLALFFFVRATATQQTTPGLAGQVRLSLGSAIGIGASCGAAVLAKGPVGFVMPVLSLGLFACWQEMAVRRNGFQRNDRHDEKESAQSRVQEIAARFRPLTILAAAMLVAGPWYALVSVRTNGAWLQGFLSIHNVGRFSGVMEGHSGSPLSYYLGVLAIGLFPWSIVLLATLAHAVGILQPRAGRPVVEDARAIPLRLLTCWCFVWVAVFSCSATKLPGYVWPAYPAFAILTGLFLCDWMRGDTSCVRWCRDPQRAMALVMRVAWAVLAMAGCLCGVGLPLAAAHLTPGLEWLGLVGLIPIACAIVAWRCQSAGHRGYAVATLAVCSCLLVSFCAAVGADRISQSRGAKSLVTRVHKKPAAADWAGFGTVPPSLFFYASTQIEQLPSAAAVAERLEHNASTHLVVDSRYESQLPSPLPEGFAVLCRMPTLLYARELILIGPVAATHHETPLASIAPSSSH